MNKDEVLDALRSEKFIKKNFKCVDVVKADDVNFGLTEYLVVSSRKGRFGVRFPQDYENVSVEEFVGIVLDACHYYVESNQKFDKLDLSTMVQNHCVRIKLSSKNLDHKVNSNLIVDTFLDFNIILQAVMEMDDQVYRMFISKDNLNSLGVTIDSVLDDAITTITSKGFSLRNLVDVLKDMNAPVDESGSVSLYILTLNDDLAYSSCALMCDSILSCVMSRLQDNFYVLPSSQYELLILPENDAYGFSTANLKEMILSVNEMLSPKEFLSSSLYYYDGEVSIIE